MIEELRIKDVKQEAERESQILQKIKMKMDRIKATQQKILEPVHEPTSHAKGKFLLNVTICSSCLCQMLYSVPRKSCSSEKRNETILIFDLRFVKKRNNFDYLRKYRFYVVET